MYHNERYISTIASHDNMLLDMIQYNFINITHYKMLAIKSG